MPEQIRDGTGKGYPARVDDTNNLRVRARAVSPQHDAAENGKAFQIVGTATLGTGTTTVIHLKNTSPNDDLVFTYLRHQVVDASGGTAFPNASNYFSVRLNRTYASGGSTVTAANTQAGSGVVAQLTAYDTNPTLAGTALELDRWYTKANGDMNTFNKEGSVIVPPNQTIEVSYVGDRTSGTIYARLSFYVGT